MATVGCLVNKCLLTFLLKDLYFCHLTMKGKDTGTKNDKLFIILKQREKFGPRITQRPEITDSRRKKIKTHEFY